MFQQVESKFERITRIQQLHQSYQQYKIEFLDELYFNLSLHKFEYQIRFSRELMIQYITTLYMYEHNGILFQVMPCHDGSQYEK